MSEPNSHIRIHGPVGLLNGNPITYLHHLRESANKLAASQPGRIQRRRAKFDFADFVTTIGARAPKTFALIADGVVRQREEETGEPVATFLAELPHGHYFCKPNMGRNGIGAFRLTASSHGMRMDDEASTLDAVAQRLSSEAYVIQEWMAPLQHPDIARFREGVINTMRLITVDGESGAKPIAASLRMAISLKSIDSWTQGGVVAGIDLEQGVLKPFGILKKGLKIVDAHPGSGLTFRDQPIPHFARAVTLACTMHHKLAGVRSPRLGHRPADRGTVLSRSQRAVGHPDVGTVQSRASAGVSRVASAAAE